MSPPPPPSLCLSHPCQYYILQLARLVLQHYILASISAYLNYNIYRYLSAPAEEYQI